MEYTSVSTKRTSKAKVLGIIALAIVGTLVASYAVFNLAPVKTQLVQVNTDAGDSDLLQQYNDWKQQHNLNFDPQEDATRAAVWAQTDQRIKNHNTQNHTYKLGHNHFSHLTPEEWAATSLGFRKPNDSAPASNVGNVHRGLSVPPASVNWVTKGAVTPVKNQGQCGSCYTFSSTGALESLAFIKTGKLYSFSEQQFIDCTYQGKYGNSGCNGGWMGECYQYGIDNKGVATEAAYPYKGTLQTCNTNAAKAWNGIIGWNWITQKSAAALKAAIADNPTSVTVEADTSTFQSYRSGIISGAPCGTNVDHAVLAVGYDTTADYYLVKNSWGTGWGEQGYFRIAITGNDAGTCGIQQWDTIPY